LNPLEERNAASSNSCNGKDLLCAVINPKRARDFAKACGRRLLQAGKAKKIALIASAHTLLGILNALVKQQVSWKDPAALDSSPLPLPGKRG